MVKDIGKRPAFPHRNAILTSGMTYRHWLIGQVAAAGGRTANETITHADEIIRLLNEELDSNGDA